MVEHVHRICRQSTAFAAVSQSEKDIFKILQKNILPCQHWPICVDITYAVIHSAEK